MGRWAPWMICMGLGLLLETGPYPFRYAEGLSYLSHDPQACMNCHVMREHYDSWIRWSHRAAASCNDCHTPHAFPEKYLVKMENGWNHSRTFTLQNSREPIRIRPRTLASLLDAILEAKARGATAEALVPALQLHRKAQFRLDCISAENSMGFHAPQESARILAEAIDDARQGVAAAQRLPATPHTSS